MPPRSRHGSYDPYQKVRCAACNHLCYRGHQTGDPCLVCPCTTHEPQGEEAVPCGTPAA
jgi:hypothetical protein